MVAFPLVLAGVQKRMGGHEMVCWATVMAEFTWEGSWRDVCVVDVGPAEWTAAVEAILKVSDRAQFMVGGIEADLPADLVDVFKLRADPGVLWYVWVAGVQLRCHFFDESEIEFDVDPREVAGPLEFDGLLMFMRALARAARKPALMTPENMHEAPFITVSPSGGVEYISSGGFFEEMARG